MSALLITSNSFALDIDEAIERGLKQSHTIKASSLNKEYSQANLDKAYSAYQPSVNLSYTISDVEQKNPDINSQPTVGTIALSYNLFNGFASKYGIKSASEILHVSEFQKRATIADTKLNIQLAYIDFLQKKNTSSKTRGSRTFTKEFTRYSGLL